VLDGAQPGDLRDVLRVGLAQPVRAGDRADEHFVAGDEPVPRQLLAGGGGADQRPGAALAALGGAAIHQ
jgi:hypothetical protein